MSIVFDNRRCALGEGPLWHPERKELFWFDILGKRLLSKRGDDQQEWRFKEHVSAAGWIDKDTLLMASETGLYRFDLGSGARSLLAPIEADNPLTRSNDGRADPFGGFWIGTMGRGAEAGAGAIYRYFQGKVTRLYQNLTIPNAICFSPDSKFAFFTDTVTGQILRQPLDAEGWPEGAAELFVDLAEEGLNPDGAVVDSSGTLWNAQWGAARVAGYGQCGSYQAAHSVGAMQSSCPAFGGPDLKTMFVTSAAVECSAEDHLAGQTFAVSMDIAGQAEHQVRV